PEGARLRPLFSRTQAELTWREHVAAIARERQSLMRFAGADLGGIIRELHWPRDPARPWWFDATLAIQPAAPRLTFNQAEASVTRVPSLHLDADLALTLRP